ncbi:MAG: hypothetical protein WAZ21_02515 [Candidatus Saccharimonadales bacterium]
MFDRFLVFMPLLVIVTGIGVLFGIIGAPVASAASDSDGVITPITQLRLVQEGHDIDISLTWRTLLEENPEFNTGVLLNCIDNNLERGFGWGASEWNHNSDLSVKQAYIWCTPSTSPAYFADLGAYYTDRRVLIAPGSTGCTLYIANVSGEIDAYCGGSFSDYAVANQMTMDNFTALYPYFVNHPINYPPDYAGAEPSENGVPPPVDPEPEPNPFDIFEECDVVDVVCHTRNIATFFTNIPQLTSALFLPSGDLFSENFNELRDFFNEKFGFLIFPIDFIGRVFTAMMPTNPNGTYPSCVYNNGQYGVPALCSLHVGPILGGELVIDFGFAEKHFPAFFNLARAALGGLVSLSLIYALHRKYMRVIKS